MRLYTCNATTYDVEQYFSSAPSQLCYSHSECAGAPFAVNSAKECCVGTDSGMSYADSSGTCIISQCIGTSNNNNSMHGSVVTLKCTFLH